MSDKPDHRSSDPSTGDEAPRRGLAGWQKLLAIVSLVVTVGGLGLMGTAALRGDATPPATVDAPRAPGLALGAVEGTPVAAAAEDRTFLDEWSPTIFKLGFSFFAAFCVAYALRSFVKIALVSIGLLLIALFALQYFDLIEVDWNEWSSRYESVAGWLRAQTGSFRTFIQGALPSSASAGLGFIAGFRRR